MPPFLAFTSSNGGSCQLGEIINFNEAVLTRYVLLTDRSSFAVAKSNGTGPANLLCVVSEYYLFDPDFHFTRTRSLCVPHPRYVSVEGVVTYHVRKSYGAFLIGVPENRTAKLARPKNSSKCTTITRSLLQATVGTEVIVKCCFNYGGRDDLDSDISLFWPNDSRKTVYGCDNLDDTMDISCSRPADGDDCWKITIPARSEYDGVEIKCSLYENGNQLDAVAMNSTNLTITENTKSTPTHNPTRSNVVDEDQKKKKVIKPSEIAACVIVGAIVMICIIISVVSVLCWCYRRRSIQRGNRKNTDGDGVVNTHRMSGVVSHSTSSIGNVSLNDPSTHGSDQPLVDGNVVESDGPGGNSKRNGAGGEARVFTGKSQFRKEYTAVYKGPQKGMITSREGTKLKKRPKKSKGGK